MTNEQNSFDEAARGQNAIATMDLKLAQLTEPAADLPPVKALAKASELADQPPLIAASLAVLITGLALREPRLARTGLRMLTSHALATGIKTIVKDNVDRTRPQKVGDDGHYEAAPGHSDDGDYRSLPSGHTAGALAVARSIVREYPRAAAPAYGLAATAALIQIPKKAHFASDIVVGATIGLASEWVTDRIARRLLR